MCIYLLNQISTYEETERRTRQIEYLQSKNVQMQKLFENQNSSYSQDRNKLIGTNMVQDLGTANWGTDDDDEILTPSTSQVTVQDIKEHQKKLMQGL